jgi:hypothetical protein
MLKVTRKSPCFHGKIAALQVKLSAKDILFVLIINQKINSPQKFCGFGQYN